MANPEVVEKFRVIVKDPEAMARLKQAQKTARETSDYLREAGRLKPGWRDVIYTI